MNKKSAFTLAEVLITLVIIGVIAAITVPSLIAKYKEEQLKSQFKKTYTTISQAFTNTFVMDFNSNLNCYYGKKNITSSPDSDCQMFFDSFLKKLSIMKKCIGNAKSNNCIPQYSNLVSEEGGCASYSENYINNQAFVYVLSDGQIIITYAKNYYPMFLVDINGLKKPNKPGYDLFAFSIYKTNKTSSPFIAGGGCEMIAPGGKSTDNMIKYSVAK